MAGLFCCKHFLNQLYYAFACWRLCSVEVLPTAHCKLPTQKTLFLILICITDDLIRST